VECVCGRREGRGVRVLWVRRWGRPRSGTAVYVRFAMAGRVERNEDEQGMVVLSDT